MASTLFNWRCRVQIIQIAEDTVSEIGRVLDLRRAFNKALVDHGWYGTIRPGSIFEYDGLRVPLYLLVMDGFDVAYMEIEMMNAYRKIYGTGICFW